MIKTRIFILFSYLLFSIAALEGKGEPLLLQREEPKIIVNNKILAQVNGKVISTLSVMKKMDMLFYRQFPQYVNSVEARFQFYQANWKHVLQEFIDKELILADAVESKIEISSGDVRQEMELYFGPDIITNLDKVGLTFDEASKMVLDDITIRRMLMYRANSKAVRLVTPALVRQAYETYAQDKKNFHQPRWEYQVISIRSPDEKTSQVVASQAHQLLTYQKVPLTELQTHLDPLLGGATKISISEPFRHHEQEMSEAYKEVLLKMPAQAFSAPLAQKSRNDQSAVYRIFYLVNKEDGGVTPFKEVEAKLKEQLLSEASEKETTAYIQKLHKHYHVQDSDLNAMVSSDYQPFTINKS